jgi:DNA-binding response OmpR family regulator
VKARLEEKDIKVLLVDDDQKLCRLVTEYLEPMGYAVTSAHTGPEGLEQALSGAFQVVILDVMLPGMDGFEVLRNLRRSSDAPVLMLTSRGDETDRIVGLEMGADDYLPKTFSTRELLARLRAVTRRSQRIAEKPDHDSTMEHLDCGRLAINIASRTVQVDGDPVDLTPVEYQVLVCLARSAGRVLTRDHLLDQVAGRDYEVFDRSVDVHISSLRRKLGDDPRTPRFIKTVRSAGYMLIRNSEDDA